MLSGTDEASRSLVRLGHARSDQFVWKWHLFIRVENHWALEAKTATWQTMTIGFVLRAHPQGLGEFGMAYGKMVWNGKWQNGFEWHMAKFWNGK